MKIYTEEAVKMAAVSSFSDDAWDIAGQSESNAAELSKRVAWLYGVMRKRAGHTGGLPYVLTRNSEPVDKRDWPIKIDLPDLMYKYSLATDLYGANYFFKVKRGETVEWIKWFDPTTITIEANEKVGLLGFTRRIGANKTLYPVKDGKCDVIWTWLPGLKELGPGEPPANVIVDAAEILRHMTITAKGFFESGAIDTWILFDNQIKLIPETEQKRLFSWLRRTMRGGTRTQGTGIYTLPPESRLEQISSPIEKWTLPELNEMEAEHICVAFDTPLMLMRPEQGSDKAMMEETKLMWTNEVVVPHAQRAVDDLNEQLLYDLGYELEIDADSMNINQEEEHKKSASFTNYVNGMIAALQAESPELIEIAAETLGIDLPENAIAELKRMAEEQAQKKEERRAEFAERMAQAPVPQQTDETIDERKAAELDMLDRFLKNGTHFTRPFHSDILTREEIRAAIEQYEYDRSFNDKTYQP